MLMVMNFSISRTETFPSPRSAPTQISSKLTIEMLILCSLHFNLSRAAQETKGQRKTGAA